MTLYSCKTQTMLISNISMFLCYFEGEELYETSPYEPMHLSDEFRLASIISGKWRYLKRFSSVFQWLKKAQFFCSRLALSFMFRHLLIRSDSLSVIDWFLQIYSLLCCRCYISTCSMIDMSNCIQWTVKITIACICLNALMSTHPKLISLWIQTVYFITCFSHICDTKHSKDQGYSKLLSS